MRLIKVGNELLGEEEVLQNGVKFRWRTMETAPKDGAQIIVHDEGRVRFVQWCDAQEFWIEGASDIIPYPTHWMPAPDLPE